MANYYNKDLYKILEEKIEIINDNFFKVKLNKDDVPVFIKNLLDNDYKVYQVNELQVSLEDAFFEKTGGNEIA